MATQSADSPNQALFSSIGRHEKVLRMNFHSIVGGDPVTLTVRKNVTKRAGFSKFGVSTHTFTFQHTGASTRPVSPSSEDSPAPNFGCDTALGERPNVTGVMAATTAEEDIPRAMLGEESIGSPTGPEPDTVILVHDRYNGGKKLFVNRVMVYSVKRECTDGNMNSWVAPLWFGKVFLTLTNKVFSVSGFEYKLTLEDEIVLFKSS